MPALCRLSLLALAAAAPLLLVLSLTSRPVRALAEADVSFTVTQSPAAPATVQVDSTVTFTVHATVTASPAPAPLYFEFDYPAGLNFVSAASDPPGVTCTDDTPATGVVRCDYGIVGTGPRVPLILTFSITGDATTDTSQARMRAGATDGAPDGAAGGDDAFNGAGTLTVFDSSMFAVTGTPTPATTFERAAATYTLTLTNNSGASTGSFDVAVQFPNAILASVSCSAGSDVSSGTTAECSGVTLADGETLTVTVQLRPDNTGAGDDIVPVLSVSALGLNELSLAPMTVNEIGLQRAAGTLAVGSPINVCTADVSADAPDTAAAGSTQPNDTTLMVGTNSSQKLLQLSDFDVTGPAAVTPAAATGCGANQSGVRFTPPAPGTYIVTARYNTGGTNVLTITVPGSASNPAPVLSAISPSSATAGSGPLTLSVTGSSFISASEVRWNGSPLVTTYVSSTSLTALVPASLLAAPGTASITVVNPSPGGGTSSSQTFTITPVAVKLAFTTQPGNGTAGQPLSVQPVVAVQTAGGATVTSDNATVVTLSVSGGATLNCTGGLSKTVTAGVAAFTGCTVSPAGSGYTLTAASTPSLTPATSSPFNVASAPPTVTSQLAFPAVAGPVPRSRLTFTATSGTLNPTEVRLVIKRNSDNKYWDASASTWVSDPVQNPASAAGSGTWKLQVTGVARRAFVNTAVTIEAFATAAGTEYRSAATITIAVR